MTRDEIPLLPCPFCGEEKNLQMEEILYLKNFFVRCVECNGQSGIGFVESDAKDRWNKRVIPARYMLKLVDEGMN